MKVSVPVYRQWFTCFLMCIAVNTSYLKEVLGMVSFGSTKRFTHKTLYSLHVEVLLVKLKTRCPERCFSNRFQREYYCYNTRYPLTRPTNKNHPSSNLADQEFTDRCLSFCHSTHSLNTPQNCLLCEPLY